MFKAGKYVNLVSYDELVDMVELMQVFSPSIVFFFFCTVFGKIL